jgi:hypothetical protein
MTNLEILTLMAIFFGPIVAVQISQFLDRRRQSYADKDWIFKTLMRTRATGASPAQVEALNMIDVTFNGDGKKDKAGVSAWKLYLDSLSDLTTNRDIVSAKRSDLFIELLHTMATRLGYDFDKVHIKNTSYYPQGALDMETEQQLIRRVVVGLLNGEYELPIRVTNVPH